MTSYVLASASGLRVGFYFFVVMSAAIAFMIYTLLTKPSARRSQLGLPAVAKGVAAPFAVLIGIVLFSAIYLSSLAGFYTVAVGNDEIRIEYAIPRRSVALRYADIGDVIRRPAYKLLWRLEIYTLDGSRFESAPGSYGPIKDAAGDIERRRKG